MKNTVIFAGCAIVISGLSTFALAHGGATGIVKERMESMETMGEVVKSLAAMMRGETSYDPATVREGAAVIRSHSGDALTGLFPEGSLQKKSEAKPEIWTDWQTFSALAGQLGVFADGLEAAAGNGLMADGGGHMMQDGQSGMMGGSMMGGGMMGGSGGMMGGGMMGGGMMDAAQLAKMPADGVFNMVTQTCSACHTKFRVEEN
ncbi:c-type cytochrome [Roseibium sp.]|uniref:c-type cytochrome n=1 Tax=Roseibium sp. TaxID=1936156 RepID=UPI003D0998C5